MAPIKIQRFSVNIRETKEKHIILSRLTTLICLFQHFKCKLSELSSELRKNYLPQVGFSDELVYFFLTYLYLCSNKCAKYQLRAFLVCLMLLVLLECIYNLAKTSNDYVIDDGAGSLAETEHTYLC